MTLIVDRVFNSPDLLEVQGRTLLVRVVPYGQSVVVRDKAGPPYREGFDPGAFAEAIANGAATRHRVGLNMGHEDSALVDVGRAIRLEEDDSGLIGSFVVDESPFGDHALVKVKTRQWTGLSVRAIIRDSRKDAAGVTWRTRAHPVHAALTDHPAYADAGVLAVRTATPRLDAWLAKYPRKEDPRG